jgi:hypothetical protein
MKHQTVLLELEYFPCVDWFTTFLTADKVYLEQHEHFVRRSYRNRCELASPNGLLTLSVPLIGGRNQRTKIKDVLICNEEPWQQDHFKTISSCYRRSAYFEYFEQDIIAFFKKKQTHLLELNLDTLALILKLLQLKKDFELTTKYEKNVAEVFDGRNIFFGPNHLNELQEYLQPFTDRNGFARNRSMLDMIFCMGKKSLGLMGYN